MSRGLPADFAFREVTDAAAAAAAAEGRDGRALEQIHKLLQGQQSRVLVQDAALSVEAASPPATPAILLGIMSGQEPRRRVLRCEWKRYPDLLQRIRVLFVVGAQQPRQVFEFGVVAQRDGQPGLDLCLKG